MSIWMFWKLFGDVCLYFSVVGALPGLFPHDFSFLIPALLCGIGTAAACWISNKDHDRLSIAAILIPLASVCLATETLEWIVLLPPVAYTGMVIIKGDYALEYLNFRDMFRKTILMWTIGFGILCLATVLEAMTQPWNTSLAYEETLRMGIYYGVSGIVLQRQLRLGLTVSESDRRLNRIQSAAVLGGTGGILLGVWGVQQLTMRYAGDFVKWFGEFLYTLCTMPLALLGWLIGLLFDDVTEFAEETQETTLITEETGESLATLGTGQGEMPTEVPLPQEAEYPWWFVILLLSLLMILFLTLLQLHRRNAQTNRSVSVFRKAAPPEKKKTENKATARAKIRRYYRSHLKMEKQKGIRLRTNQTSADILDGVSPTTDKKAAAALREVYLKARYNENAELSQSDVQDAKDALKRLRSS